jgi:hypothetical protein
MHTTKLQISKKEKKNRGEISSQGNDCPLESDAMYRLVDIYQHLKGISWLYFQSQRHSSTLKIMAAYSSCHTAEVKLHKWLE